jgi:hypothetical protein
MRPTASQMEAPRCALASVKSLRRYTADEERQRAPLNMKKLEFVRSAF